MPVEVFHLWNMTICIGLTLCSQRMFLFYMVKCTLFFATRDPFMRSTVMTQVSFSVGGRVYKCCGNAPLSNHQLNQSAFVHILQVIISPNSQYAFHPNRPLFRHCGILDHCSCLRQPRERLCRQRGSYVQMQRWSSCKFSPLVTQNDQATKHEITKICGHIVQSCHAHQYMLTCFLRRWCVATVAVSSVNAFPQKKLILLD